MKYLDPCKEAMYAAGYGMDMARKTRPRAGAGAQALDVLKELLADVEAVGTEYVRGHWPDILETYWHARAVVNGRELYKCQNGCGTFGPESVKQWWPDLPDINDRINPGEVVPYCECPRCGALAHKVKNGTSKA